MIIHFAIALTLLLGFCGLVLDIGTFELKKIQMQNAADAAAIGAMRSMEGGAQKVDWQSAGKSDAKLNGFTDTQNDVVVAVDNPGSGPYAGDNSAIQATVTQMVHPLFFPATWILNAQATALAPPAITPCMYALSNVSTSTGYSLSAANTNIDTDCSFYMGRSMSLANGSLTNSSGTAKPYLLTGSPKQSYFSGAPPTPAPSYNQPVMPDPLSNLLQPKLGTCDHTNVSVPSGNHTALSPGVYCGRLSIINNTSIHFNAGLYTFTDGVSIINSAVNGTGVTFFLTKNSGDSWSTTKQFSASNSPLTFSAPMDNSTGTPPAPGYPPALGIQGILVFADRNWNTGDVAFSLTNSLSSTLDGILYLPHTGVSMTNSQVQSNHYFGMVADSIALANGTSIAFKSDYSSLANGNPFQASGSGSGGGLVE